MSKDKHISAQPDRLMEVGDVMSKVLSRNMSGDDAKECISAGNVVVKAVGTDLKARAFAYRVAKEVSA